MKNKIILSIVAVLLVLGGVGFGMSNNSTDTTSQNTIRIGMLAPLTGPGASLGEWTVRGASFAVEKINQDRGITGKTIELIVEDDGCAGKTALNATQKLLAQGITQIIGPLCGAARVPVLSANDGNETIFITTGLSFTSNPNLNKYAFNVLPPVSLILETILDFIYQKNPSQKVSLLYTDDEYGKENQLSFDAYTLKQNKNAITYPFSKGSADLRTQILKLKTDRSNVVVMTAFPPEYGVFLKQAKELSLTKTIFAVSSIQTPEVAEMNKQTKQKIHYSYPRISDLISVKAISEEYRKKKPDAPASLPMYFGSGYDAVALLAIAMQNCKSLNNACIRDHIASTKNYSGANGLISFNEYGDNSAKGAIEIRVLENGVFSKLQ